LGEGKRGGCAHRRLGQWLGAVRNGNNQKNGSMEERINREKTDLLFDSRAKTEGDQKGRETHLPLMRAREKEDMGKKG